jgi:hypothetical protein
MNMSPLATGILGAAAVSLSLGAAQLALGSDFSQGLQVFAATPAASINRAGKTDRAAGVARSDGPTRTISLRLDSLSDMSVLVRVPVAQAARNGAFIPSLMRSGNEKPTVACDPVVSVLTEVAKQLQPGRCVT